MKKKKNRWVVKCSVVRLFRHSIRSQSFWDWKKLTQCNLMSAKGRTWSLGRLKAFDTGLIIVRKTLDFTHLARSNNTLGGSIGWLSRKPGGSIGWLSRKTYKRIVSRSTKEIQTCLCRNSRESWQKSHFESPPVSISPLCEGRISSQRLTHRFLRSMRPKAWGAKNLPNLLSSFLGDES
jgi:hypothetical protein